jgi:hypothetical protein
VLHRQPHLGALQVRIPRRERAVVTLPYLPRFATRRRVAATVGQEPEVEVVLVSSYCALVPCSANNVGRSPLKA